MLDIGWSELLLIAIVAIVVVGPKDLPKLMRTVGVYAGKVRRAAADFQRQFEAAVAESEADEVRKNIEAIRANMGTTADFSASVDKPLMLPTTAPQSIEQAIAPPRPARKPKNAAKSAAKSKPETRSKPKPAKTAAKPKLAAKRAKPKAERKR